MYRRSGGHPNGELVESSSLLAVGRGGHGGGFGWGTVWARERTALGSVKMARAVAGGRPRVVSAVS